jgi:hypothetical protein
MMPRYVCVRPRGHAGPHEPDYQGCCVDPDLCNEHLPEPRRGPPLPESFDVIEFPRVAVPFPPIPVDTFLVDAISRVRVCAGCLGADAEAAHDVACPRYTPA